ncbi:hypothetical protein ACIP9C_22650 [Lysinibacillus sp. NPDC093210]|uniref:hypothetical protein n=1 Tax=Lysinibacillus sp. NPDC093210 TaxID=3364133 RepID=UPI00382FC67F
MKLILNMKNGTEDSIDFGRIEEVSFESQFDFLEFIRQNVLNNSELRIGDLLDTKTTWSEVKSVEILINDK